MSVVDKSLEFIESYISQKPPDGKPLIVQIEGPQGSGKTTATVKIKEELAETYPHFNIVQFSMDDFYLTYEQQQRINLEHQTNPLLQGRGLPGTHDLDLLKTTFDRLVSNDIDEEQPVLIPSYDKSAHGGKGDRSKHMLMVDRKVDIVIFEGWLNGYRSLPLETLLEKWTNIKKEFPKFDNIGAQCIIDINCFLQLYQKIWDDYCDLFICIKTYDIENVYKWRLQQEHSLKLSTGNGMTDFEVERFIDRYMPIYYLYYDTLEITKQKVKTLELNIDISRNLISSKL